MRTSDEVYHRVRWDPRFDPARFVLGINQRGAAPKRVPLSSFVPGGDIPWHRIVFVEADGEVLWDRATGVDRIDATDAGRVRSPRLLRAPFFTARTPFRWEPDAGWRPAGAVPPAPVPGTATADVRVLTWNTLWDRYDGDRIDTARRRPLLLAALEDADADVIALQEVEAGLLTMLMRAPWVRAGYTLGTDPGGKDVDDSGLLLLSRLPVREAGWHVLGRHKAVTAVTVDTGSGPLVVAATHLSSDHSDNGAGLRQAQLARLAEGLGGVDGDLVLVGDFNDGGAAPATALGLRDVWTEVHGPGDGTPTFDPGVNPLAALSSRSGRASRLDRILLRPGRLYAAGAFLRGDSPTADGLYVSDHYGVAADLRPGAAEPAGNGHGASPAARTAPAPGVLGGPGEPGGPAAEREAQNARTLEIVRRVSGALADGVVHLAGSRRMGCAPAGADVDLIAALPGTVDPAGVRARVAAALPDATRMRQVTGARVPGLRLRTGGLDVDLVVVATGTLDPGEAVARRTELGEAAAIALSAVSDAEAVRAAVGDRHTAFARLATRVKAWAGARGLDSAPFGGLPGLAWSVLAARTVREADAAETEAGDVAGADAGDVAEAGDAADPDPLRHFFGTWAAWDWRQPVGLTPAAAGPQAPVVLLTSTDPVRNCTGHVTTGYRDLLTDELYRAWSILERAAETGADPWPELVSPPSLHRRHAAWAVVTVDPDRAGEFEETLGRVRGRLRALLTALADAGAADAHAWPRPFETGPAFARYAIGLGRTPPDAVRLAAIAEEWRRGLRGVGVARAEPDGVPALR